MTRTITLSGYATLLVAMVACETVARRTDRLLTFDRALAWCLRRRTVRLLVLAGWMWLGWHVFVRVHR